ncbi:putative membrane protein [Actinomadura luteofluorescens]|uniref:Putative membrane protein n=2 Tax=Actinomadura luteofluorescens TaxID=46163 RepID=A0A7Y9EGS4_9ACTN|nr:anthrone oxygenase family protein [Actinomadura luteofluorescens]NYD47352.1 putative membrane protein [Actinomadura luteofluorescens]
MKILQTATMLAALISTGLMAGLFTGFAYAVMPGLNRSSDRTLIEAMQGINKAILNPAFMLPFMGSIPLIALAVFLAWRGHGRPAMPWLIAALALYLIAFMVTTGVNVPLNDQLAKAGDPQHIDHLATVRDQFENKWVIGNTVRALLHTAAFACLAWALVVFGAHRLNEGSGTTGSAVPSTHNNGAATIPAAPHHPRPVHHGAHHTLHR